MAVVVTPVDSRVSLMLQVGADENGNPVLRTRSYSGVKPAAADQEVFDTAQALAGLQQHPVEMISRIDENELSEGAA